MTCGVGYCEATQHGTHIKRGPDVSFFSGDDMHFEISLKNTIFRNREREERSGGDAHVIRHFHSPGLILVIK
jgi:hypothetical protein